MARAMEAQLFWKAAAGFLLIALSHTALGAVAYRFVADEMVMREAAVAQDFLESIVRAEAIKPAAFSDSKPGPALMSFASHTEQLSGMVRVTVYSLDGFIRHSTEANLIGIKFHDNDELAEALKGELKAKLEEDSEDKPEQLGLTREAGEPLLETYIPVRDKDGAVMGVVEFYKRPVELFASLSRIQTRITIAAWASAVLLSGVFLLGWILPGRRRGA
jgi:two-component system, NtrC family, sensor histidine kinase HydH